ncbi:helix-turn-helix transcriptional regulator [Bacteriovoracaceae bacterium]|nr:helix-turn-helix transcriptional regulator [Bacteriovoracaceae bacterium]
MIRFYQDKIDLFLAIVRKYMQFRGGFSQKELAVHIDVGISTMSRFLNNKTSQVDEQVVAKLVAFLDIPLHEMIDFVHEDSTASFKGLVQFYKNLQPSDKSNETTEDDLSGAENIEDSFEKGLGGEGIKKQVFANIQVGNKKRSVPFGGHDPKNKEDTPLREKLNRLSPRQKAYLTDFLNLDVEGRDLIVDVGNALFRYFKQGGLEI